MSFEVLSRYYHTVRHLKAKQVAYRAYYLLRAKFQPLKFRNYDLCPNVCALSFTGFPAAGASLSGDNTFTFVNKTQRLGTVIDWNYGAEGKLWTYHLNYFDFLHQPDMEAEAGKQLIRSFVDQDQAITDGMEPYPISLRGINWIKFLSRHQIHDAEINASLYTQYQLLSRQIEYHLMGNHLLENGMSLLFGAFYFGEKDLFDKATLILSDQLEEQVLSNGAHFERSPMYHLILLNRLLDCLNLVSTNKHHRFYSTGLELLLLNKCRPMLQWLAHIRLSSGSLPAFNDSTNRAPVDPAEVLKYGKALGIDASQPAQQAANDTLDESGYLIVRRPRYELVIDAGKPGPDYIPGHVHCDIFSFILEVDGLPVIVDPGISTYEEGEVRDFERSTAAHNTVSLERVEQSDVWKSHRVGRRAKVVVHMADKKNLIASHDGFQSYKLRHKRAFRWDKDHISIKDHLEGQSDKKRTAYYHFHPSRKVTVNDNTVGVDDLLYMSFNKARNISISTYQYAQDFNILKEATVVAVTFDTFLVSEIKIRG